MFEQSFKNIDDILHKDAGCSSEIYYLGTSPKDLGNKWFAFSCLEENSV